MNGQIATYGLTKQQLMLLEAALPEEYELTTAECVTDLIVTDATCTIIESSSLDKNALNTLLAYYMDVGDRLDETVVWLRDAELPKLPSFVMCSGFLDLLTELESILTRAQVRYDTMQMYGSEYAYLPKHAIEESIEADINTALHRKYGMNPDPLIVKRMRQELTALREVNALQNALQDLAAVYELSRWLKAHNIPFFVEYVTASGLIPYLLGITHTNPLPPHTFCPECKKLHWKSGYKDGFDIPASFCPDCGTDLIRDGHSLIWQEYCYGPIPTYGFWLPASTQEQISRWVENHWRKQDWKTAWGAVQRENSRIDVGPFYFIFALDETEIKPDFHHQTVTAEQTGELIRLVGSKWQNYDGIGMPYPKNAAEALAVYELMKDSGTRNKCAKYLLHCGLGIADLICCREDIFYYLCDHGFTEKDAIRGMHRVRKGRGFPFITEEMRNARDKWVLTQCADASHLPSKAADWERLLFQIRCGWAPHPNYYDGLSTGSHQFYFGARNNGKHIAVKMDRAALVFSVRKHFSHGFQHSQTLVSNNELDSLKTSPTKPLEEADPAGLVLLHAFGSTQNLTVAILIDGNCHQNSYIFVLSTPVSLEVDTVHIHIRVLTALQGTVAPGLDIDIGFLVQLADGGGRYLAAPQSLSNILNTAHGYTCQIHLDESFLYAALPAAVALDNGSLKRDALEAGHMERHIPVGGGEISVIVTAAVALTGLAALVPGSLGEFFCFGFQQFVECLLHAAADQLLNLPLEYFLVELYNVVGHGLLSPFRMCVATSFYQRLASRVYFYCLFQFAQLIVPYHLQETVTEEMFEAMVLCAISGRWLVIGTEKVVLPIHVYRLTNPTIGKHQKMIINYNNIRLREDAYSEKDYIIANKTDENLFYLANRLSAIKRWRVPTCLLPLYDEIRETTQSYPHPSGYFAHTCKNHFLDLPIQEIEAECKHWSEQRHTWYQQVIDALIPLLKEQYNYVKTEKDPLWARKYNTRFNLDPRKEKTLNIELWEKDSCLFVMSNDASCDIVLNNAIDAVNAEVVSLNWTRRG